MTRLPKRKISWRRGKQYTSPVTLGGGGHKNLKADVGTQEFLSSLGVVRENLLARAIQSKV